MSTKSKFCGFQSLQQSTIPKKSLLKKTLEFLTSPWSSRMNSSNQKELFPMHFDSQIGSQLFCFIRTLSPDIVRLVSSPPPLLWRNSSISPPKICVAAVERRRSGKRTDRMNLSLPPKSVGKLVGFPVISFCIIFISSYTFDALLWKNWPFSTPNCATLQITILCDLHSVH